MVRALDPNSDGRHRSVPLKDSITRIPGYPRKLVIFKIPASSYWWVRYYAEKRVFKRTTKTEIKRDVNGNLDNKQIESLEKLKKSYQTAKETANTKKMLQMAAAAAFAAAAATAFMMAANEGLMNEVLAAARPPGAAKPCGIAAGTFLRRLARRSQRTTRGLCPPRS